MLKVLLIGFGFVPSLLWSQGKALKYEMEVQQLRDLKEGILLIPVEEPSLVVAGGSGEVQRQLMEHRAYRSSFDRADAFGTWLFFDVADTARLRSDPGAVRVWTPQGDAPPHWPLPERNLFILEYKPARAPFPADIHVFNAGVQRREAIAEANARRNASRRSLKAQKLRKKMRLHADSWDYAQLMRHVRRLERLEEPSDTTAFFLALGAFDQEDPQHEGYLVARLYPHQVQPRPAFRYMFNFHYFIRVHPQVRPEVRYEQAAQSLAARLRKRLVELEEKYR